MPVNTEALTIDLQSNTGEVTIGLTDIAGKIILTEKKTVVEGQNTVVLPLSKIANGVYFLTINDGKTQVIEKIIKQ